MRVVGPKTTAWGEHRMVGYGLSSQNQSARAFQHDASVRIPTDGAVLVEGCQCVFGCQVFVRKAALGKVRKTLSLSKSNASRIKADFFLNGCKDISDTIRHAHRFVENAQYVDQQIPSLIVDHALGDITSGSIKDTIPARRRKPFHRLVIAVLTPILPEADCQNKTPLAKYA